jgi:hypothetical protein
LLITEEHPASTVVSNKITKAIFLMASSSFRLMSQKVRWVIPVSFAVKLAIASELIQQQSHQASSKPQ